MNSAQRLDCLKLAIDLAKMTKPPDIAEPGDVLVDRALSYYQSFAQAIDGTSSIDDVDLGEVGTTVEVFDTIADDVVDDLTG